MPVQDSLCEKADKKSGGCHGLECILNHPDQTLKNLVKISFWDVLSTILFAASLVMGSAFYFIYNHPDSHLNPFPPPTPAVVITVPTITATTVSLPDIWTPEPSDEPDTAKIPAEDISPSSKSLTNTPVLVLPTLSAEGTQATSRPKSSGMVLSTKNPLQPTGKADQDNKVITITAPIGVFNNTWQNIQSIPSFSWSTSKSVQEIDHYLLYFGPKQNGKLSVNTTKMHYSSPAVQSGIYYFRIVAIAKTGKIIGSPSSFLFKYDDKPPRTPKNLATSSTSDTDRPFFTWTESTDMHSGMVGGLSGYSIYQGTSSRCGKPVAFTTVTNWTPVYPLNNGVKEYFCVRAMDAIGNESAWEGPVAFTYSN